MVSKPVSWELVNVWGTSLSSRRMKKIKTRRPTRPSFLAQAVGVCDRMATWKDETEACASAGKGLRECFSGRRLDSFVLAIEPSLLPCFLASPKNSPAFHENSLGLKKRRFEFGEHPWPAQLKSQRRFHPKN
jgi:hypothetical protein